MIAEAPVAAASSVAGMFDKVKAYIATAQSAAADGLTWAEFGELMVALVRLLVESLDAVSVLTGPQKKAMVLEAVGLLFDAVADQAVPAYLYPLWLLARPAVRQLVVALAAGAVEQILPLVRA
jgi:hypothetical protein